MHAHCNEFISTFATPGGASIIPPTVSYFYEYWKRGYAQNWLQSRKIKIGSEDLLQCAVNIYH